MGFPLDDWQPRQAPRRTPMVGNYCRVEPIDPARHAKDLHVANLADTQQRLWTYMGYGPFASLADYISWLEGSCLGDDPLFHAIVDQANDQAIGVASFLRIEPAVGVIEVGHINYSPRLQQTRAATETMYLMMRRVFDELGFRRYEWKCDDLNAPSRAAAVRLGFTFEGIFRQATIYKNRNRDTAWFSILDHEWPPLKDCYERWLAPGNFDGDGRQRTRLSALIASARENQA